MKKQRICIVGDGLTGLMSALALNSLPSLEVHLIVQKNKFKKDRRTTAISNSNYELFQEVLSKLDKKLFWPSKKIKLFFESNDKKINFLNFSEDKKNLMYIFENDKIKEVLNREIKKKKIKIIKKNINKSTDLNGYDLKVLCLGRNSKIYQNVIKSRSIEKDYKEIAFTGYVKHNLKEVITSQFFLKEGPLAILPFCKDRFSFVWSLNKDFYNINAKDINKIIEDKILDVLEVKKKISVSNIQSYPINLGLKRQYYNKNILILGEGLHSIHPIAGQGFNLVLRDIKKLKEILKYYSALGISIKNSYALNDFYNSRKPENIIMGLGIDATHKFFKKNKYLDHFKGAILKNISNNETLKKLSKIISNKGLSF